MVDDLRTAATPSTPPVSAAAAAGRAVVLAIGSAGDVAPLAAVAAALARRGVPTTLMAPARYAFLCPAGVSFRAIGADAVFEEVFSSAALWTARHGLASAWRAYGAAALSGLTQLQRDWSPRDTVLVSSTFAVAARLVQQAAGFVNTTVHLSPAVMFSYRCPPRWPGGSIPPSWPAWARVGAASLAERAFVDPVIRRALAPACEAAGVAPRGRLFSQFLHSPHRVAYLFPPWFAPAAPDWPPAGVHLGFPRVPPLARAPAPPVADFLARDDGPLAIVTAGTAVARPPRWLDSCIEALGRGGARVLVPGPDSPGAPPGDGRRWLRASAVPLHAVLPRAQLIVHHGGIGTAVEAMRSGTAQWLFPMAHDQPDNAARLQALGVARVWAERTPTDTLASAWRDGPAARAADSLDALRTRLAGEPDGAERVAEAALADLAALPIARTTGAR